MFVKLAVTVWKVSKYEVYTDPYFSVFGLNSELRIWTIFTQCVLNQCFEKRAYGVQMFWQSCGPNYTACNYT